MILFEIQKFDAFFAEQRGFLSLKTKKEYFGHFIQSMLLEWRQLTAKAPLSSAAAPAPAGAWIPLIPEALDYLRFIHSEALTFYSQDGIENSPFYIILYTNINKLNELLSDFPSLEDDEDIREFLAGCYSLIASLDISHFETP
jgi:hypothetical protein